MRDSAKGRLARRAYDAKQRALGRERGDGGSDGIPGCDAPELIWEIHRLLDQISTDGEHLRLGAVLDEVAKRGPELQAGLIYWVDVIEVLVQTAEGRYKPEQGYLKKDEVKSVLLFVLRTNRVQLPAEIPRYLQPVMIDFGADFAVDAIVALFREQEALKPGRRPWVVDPPARPSISAYWRGFKRFVMGALRTILDPLARIGSRIWLALRYPTPISPALKAALNAIESDPALRDRRLADPGADIVRVTQFIADNRDALVAGIRLVGIVTQEVETFSHLSGSDKKACARELIFAVIEDLGFDTSGLLTRVKLEFAIDMAIDTVVHLFNKRQLFDPAPARLAATAPRPAPRPRPAGTTRRG